MSRKKKPRGPGRPKEFKSTTVCSISLEGRHVRHLKKVKKSGTDKSAYIRGLIDQDMENK